MFEVHSHSQAEVLEAGRIVDGDAVLYLVRQTGPACHTGRHSCFFQRLEGDRWHAVEPVLKDPSAIYGKK